MKRLALIAAVGSILVGCGSASPSVDLKYADGHIETLYIQVRRFIRSGERHKTDSRA
jgi:hypothetical protein